MAKKNSAEEKLANLQAAQLAAQVANWAAQLEFQKERFRLLELPQYQTMSQLEIDKLAFQKAEAAWKRAAEEASLTGMYQGQPTLAWLEQQARLTGVLNGQQTLEGKLTDAQLAQMNHAMQMQTEQMLLEREKFGFDKSKWDAEFGYQQQKDLRDYELQKAGLSGYMEDGTSTLEREQIQGQQVQSYLNLLSSLQGPGNAFKMARVLGQTPEGLRSLADAWTGKYQMAGFAGGAAPQQAQVSDLYTQYDQNTGLPVAGQQPIAVQPMSQWQQPVQGANAPLVDATPVGGFQRPVTGQQAAPMQGYVLDANGQPVQTQVATDMQPENTYSYMPVTERDPQQQGYTYSPPGTQAPVGTYNYEQSPSGQTQVYPPGVQAPVQGAQASTTVPVNPGSFSTGMPTPSQINAREYKRSNKFNQELGWAAYEDAGWDKMAAQDAFLKSLPKYGYKGASTGKVVSAAA